MEDDLDYQIWEAAVAGDGACRVAWAVQEVAEAIKDLAKATRELGMNGAVSEHGASMGAIEVLAMEVHRLADLMRKDVQHDED